MAGLLIEWSREPSAAWGRMRDALSAREAHEWRDESRGVSLAATGGGRIVSAEECVIALEGEVDAAEGAAAIAAAYRRRGIAHAAAIEGERAFALWDMREARLVLVPDGASRRTLAYFWDGRTLLAASRALALLRDPRVPKAWDDAYVTHAALGTWAPPDGTTAFRGVRRTCGGEAVVVEDGRLRVVEAAPIEAAADAPRTPGEARDAVRAILERAARARMAGAAPCVALSGGIDSTAVAMALLANGGGADAFSCVGKQAEGERRLLQVLLTGHAALRWHPVDCTDAAALFDPTGLPLADDPVAIGPAFQHARARLRRAVAAAGFPRFVDGEGGDEVLAHAVRRGRHALRPRALAALPIALRARLVRLALRRHPWLARTPSARAAVSRVADDTARVAGLAVTDSERCRLLLRGAPWVGAAAARAELGRATGVESRSPLVDPPVVRLLLGIAARMKSRPGEKRPLREALEGRVPAAVLAAPKMNDLYAALRDEALASAETARAIALLAKDAALASLVDVAAVDAARRSPELGFARREELVALLRLAEWRARVAGEFGVQVV